MSHPIGLVNLGNTCFLNACLQVLNQTHELTKIVRTKTSKDNTDGILFREWRELQQFMQKSSGAVAPNSFVHHLQQVAILKKKDLFTGHAQNDMPEFLLLFIECIHNSISRNIQMIITGRAYSRKDRTAIQCYEMLKAQYEKEYSEVMEMFYAIYVSEIASVDGVIVHTIKPEQFFILVLPIPIAETYNEPKDDDSDSVLENNNDNGDNSSDSDSVLENNNDNGDNSSDSDSVLENNNDNGDNSSDSCKENIDNTISLSHCFDEYTKEEYLTGENAWFNKVTGIKEDIRKRIVFWNLPKILVITLQRFCPFSQRKLNNLILYPVNGLDLSKYVSGYNPKKYIFDLYGVCNHIGGVQGGHYTAFVKNSMTNKWTLFNDTLCEEVEDEKRVVTSSAYCLFYRMVST